MITFDKTELRRELIEKRRAIFNKDHKDAVIFKKLITLPEFIHSDSVLIYISINYEVDTRRIINYCFNNNIRVAVPGIVDEKMKFFWLNRDFELTSHAAAEYIKSSVVIVPGLAFNSDNKRLGYGGGYYDRFLKDFRGLKIGLCYSEFIMDIPTEEHDEGVDLIVLD